MNGETILNRWRSHFENYECFEWLFMANQYQKKHNNVIIFELSLIEKNQEVQHNVFSTRSSSSISFEEQL